MFNKIDAQKSGPCGQDMMQAVQTCVHCGFCLPSCPTYQILGEEADSPRGRIVLMKHVLEGDLAWADAKPHIDRCLGCLACETSCPSGVQYSHLLSPFRDHIREIEKRPPTLARRLMLATLPFPNRFRLAMRLAQLTAFANRMVPKSLRPMLALVPKKLPPADPIRPGTYSPTGTRRGRVALLSGCAQQVLAPEINRSSLNVLLRNGIEVVVPPKQQCCGALAWHVGQGETARSNAQANIAAFAGDYDAIITTAAGCGSALHEYPLVMRGLAGEADAQAFAKKAKDILTYLNEVGIERPPSLTQKTKVAYHDACHLAHAQRQTAPPRQLLRMIDGLELVPLRDSDLCCGSAGSYNVDQPEIAAQLGHKKATSIVESHCQVVAMANIGCQIQVVKSLEKLGRHIPVLHVVRILDLAYQGKPLSNN